MEEKFNSAHIGLIASALALLALVLITIFIS
jgi:hypothetical protein